MKKAIATVFFATAGALAGGCTDSGYTLSLASHAIGAAEAGLVGTFEVRSESQGKLVNLESYVDISEVSPGVLQVAAREAGDRQAKPDTQNFTVIKVAGKILLEAAADGKFTLSQVTPVTMADGTNALKLVDLKYTDAFKQRSLVKRIDDAAAGSSFYLADNAEISAEELVANTKEDDAPVYFVRSH
jgi:hypothetical protein